MRRIASNAITQRTQRNFRETVWYSFQREEELRKLLHKGYKEAQKTQRNNLNKMDLQDLE